MQNAPVLVNVVDAFANLTAEQRHFFRSGNRRNRFAMLQIVFHFAEYPRRTDGCTAHHNAVDTVAVEIVGELFGRGDVAVADNRYLYARIVLHLSNQCPVGLSGVHLAACASVNGQRLDAAVLKLFGKRSDDFVLTVPAQTGFHRHRQLHGLDNGSRDGKQLGNVAEHTGSRTLRCHLLHRATEIDVNHVRSGRFCYAGCLHHRFHLLAVYLNGNGAFRRIGVELACRAVDVAHQCIGRNEFRVNHIGTLFLADKAERRVGHILHRRKQHRLFAQIYIVNLHFSSFLSMSNSHVSQYAG